MANLSLRIALVDMVAVAAEIACKKKLFLQKRKLIVVLVELKLVLI